MELPLFVNYGLSTDIHVVDIPFQYIKSMKWIIHAMVITMDNDPSKVCSCTIKNIPKWWGQIGILNCHIRHYPLEDISAKLRSSPDESSAALNTLNSHGFPFSSLHNYALCAGGRIAIVYEHNQDGILITCNDCTYGHTHQDQPTTALE